jgi:hypothetical protein
MVTWAVTTMKTLQLEDGSSISIREALDTDASFIFRTWLRSYRTSLFARQMSNETYYGNHKVLVEAALRGCRVIVAVDPEDPDHIIGWSCFLPSSDLVTVHYVFVKEQFRGMGIMKILLQQVLPNFPNTPFECTHMPPDKRPHSRTGQATYFEDFLRDKLGVSYNPYPFLEQREELQ